MEINKNFYKIFGNTPIIGMIHLSGNKPVERALEEIAMFEEEGIDGALVENYHCHDLLIVEKTLEEISKRNNKIAIGLNLLSYDDRVFPMAAKYGAKFIQMDRIAGIYTSGKLDIESYSKYKEKFPELVVLGGVWPKYYHPVKGSDLAADLEEGMNRAEAIVVTGEGTGKETPISKIKYFREKIDGHVLIVGAGLTPDNAYEQLMVADGAIVGSSIKPDSITHNKVDSIRIKSLMEQVKKARAYKEN